MLNFPSILSPPNPNSHPSKKSPIQMLTSPQKPHTHPPFKFMLVSVNDTLNLSKTPFPMKGNFSVYELIRVAHWQKINLHELRANPKEKCQRHPFHSPRWSSVHQWRGPYRYRPQQMPKRNRTAIQNNDGV